MNTTYKRFGAFSSSENPDALADTVKGVILGLASVILLVSHWLGLNIGTAEITNFAIGAGTAASSLWIAYGLIKKGVVWLLDTFHTLKAKTE